MKDKIKTVFDNLEKKGAIYSFGYDESDTIKQVTQDYYKTNKVKDIKINRTKIREWKNSDGTIGGITKTDSMDVTLELSGEEADSLVCDGAYLYCPYLDKVDAGGRPAGYQGIIFLRIYDESVKLMGEDPIATEADKEPKNFSSGVTKCLKGGICDKKGFYWKEETLSQNIISNGKRVVLMTSKLCCGKHNVELDIIFNGQDFSEFEGKKNEFLMFYEDNPWIFVSSEGVIDFIGVSYIDSENIGILFNGGIKKVPENIPNVISNILENYKKAAFKTGRGFEASPFNSVTLNGYRMMLSGKIIGDEELEAEGKKNFEKGLKYPPLKGEIRKGKKYTVENGVEDISDAVLDGLKDGVKEGVKPEKNVFKEVSSELKPKKIGMNIIKDKLKEATVNYEVYDYINHHVPEHRNFLKFFYPSNNRYRRSIEYMKNNKYLIMTEKDNTKPLF